MVNKQAMVKFIDCDSYQIESGNDLFLCEVGVPEYTPPELQSKSFRDTRRTFNHDNFGLAVLIFKILMMGRHPYSGDGAPSEIGEAIKKNYFCYGEAAKVNGIYTQQASFLYEILDVKLQSLFNDAFTNNMSRPSAVLWKNALSEVEATLKICPDNFQGHKRKAYKYKKQESANRPSQSYSNLFIHEEHDTNYQN